jgi:flagellar basal body rod protein FlgG
MRRAVDDMRREAQTVAHATVAGANADLTGAMVRSLEHQRAAEASAAMLRCADQALGSVIDILV